jgi:hypothetical protein
MAVMRRHPKAVTRGKYAVLGAQKGAGWGENLKEDYVVFSGLKNGSAGVITPKAPHAACPMRTGRSREMAISSRTSTVKSGWNPVWGA